MIRVCFLDRDDTLIKASKTGVQLYEEPYNVQLMPGVVEGLELIVRSGFVPIVASNQPGIGLERTTEKNVRLTNALINDRLWQFGSPGISLFKHCPHVPNTGCRCRKPGPGLAYDAHERLNIDLKNSIMIGDSQCDVEFTYMAGLRGCWLARSRKEAVSFQFGDTTVRGSECPDFFTASKVAMVEAN